VVKSVILTSSDNDLKQQHYDDYDILAKNICIKLINRFRFPEKFCLTTSVKCLVHSRTFSTKTGVILNSKGLG